MIKILIVEDEGIIAEDMNQMLSDMGYEVLETAMDYEEALEILSTETPDLILLDVNLGEKKDGIDLAEVINEKYQVPFIFTTSFSDTQTLERAKHVSPVNYLVKPFKKEQLFTAIEMALFAISEKTKVEELNKTEEVDNLVIKDSLFIKDKYRYTKLVLAEILWLKAEGNYIEIHLKDRKELIRSTLTQFLEKINKANFLRTHKSYAINLDYLTRLEPTEVFILDIAVPITKTYSESLVKRLEVL
jgi:DNA-binding LytR/AlgR family response regulator